MKGIAILAMLCHHLYAFPPDGVEPYTGVLHWFGVLGKVCVALFLFCSGYGLAANYKPISFKEDLKFIGRRLVKFYLNYWVIFLIFVPITIFCFHRPLSAAYGEHVNIYKRLIYDILGVQGTYSYIITWWFNKLIIILYILFPLLNRGIRHMPWWALLFSIALTRIAYEIPDICNPADVCTWQLPFVFGIVWKCSEFKGEIISKWFVQHKSIAAGISVVLLGCAILLRMKSIIPDWTGIRMDGLLSCTIALCVITIFRNFSYIMDILAFLGKHSMNIYLMHTFFNGYWYLECWRDCEGLRGVEELRHSFAHLPCGKHDA